MTAPSYSVSIYNRRPVRLKYRLIADFSDAVSEMTPCQAQPKAQDAQHQTLSAPSQLTYDYDGYLDYIYYGEWLCRNCCNGTPRVNCLEFGEIYDRSSWKAIVSDLGYIYQDDYIDYDYYGDENKPDRIERDRIEPEPQYDAALRQADRMESRRAKRRHDMPKYSRRDRSVKRRGRSLVDGWIVVANIERKYRHVDGFECDCTSATHCTDSVEFDLADCVAEGDWD